MCIRDRGQITSAIHYVTSDTLSKVYLINGHGENELTESFVSAMGKEGVEAEPLKLTSADRVPEDGGCLFRNVPVSDLTDRERDVDVYKRQTRSWASISAYSCVTVLSPYP